MEPGELLLLCYKTILHIVVTFFPCVNKYRLSSKFTVRPGDVSLFLKYAQTVGVSRDLSCITAVGFPSLQLCKRQRAARPLCMLCSALGFGCCSQRKRLVFRSMFLKTMGAEQTFVLQSCFFSGTSNLNERLSCFISTTKRFVLSPKNTQGCQWSLGMHVAHGSLNVGHYSANNTKEYSTNSKCFDMLVQILYKEYNPHTFIFNCFQFYCTAHAE